MSAMKATLLSAARAAASVRTDPAPQRSQTVLYLLLGAFLGVAYSLGTEKFIRAMQHRHIFVRNAMLWLAALFWMFAAAAVATLASLIYNQVDGGLEGFDRVLGVLIPIVVRADLIVDWAKRVAWALLNMNIWTQSVVQTRRLMARAPAMRRILTIGDDVKIIAPSTTLDFHKEMLAAEQRVWTEDSHSLVTFTQVTDHFSKLSRVALYALCGLTVAVPGAIGWIVYAFYHFFQALSKRSHLAALLYFLSVLLAPVGAVILVLASAGLLCGVVTLSVVGTVIQFAVFWCTRVVYAMVRITLSQTWAGFPALHMPSTSSPLIDRPEQAELQRAAAAVGQAGLSAKRDAEEAGAAIALVGSLLPTELEFALASWDGKHHGHKSKPLGFSLSRHIFASSTAWLQALQHADNPLKPASVEKLSQHSQPTIGATLAAPPQIARMPSRRAAPHPGSDANSLHGSWSDMGDLDDDVFTDEMSITEVVGQCARTLGATASGGAPSMGAGSADSQRRRQEERARENEMAVVLLGRLGLDLTVASARQRRLSTFYSLGMLVHLQAESGGNAWCLHTIEELSDAEFEQRVQRFNCRVADEARVAANELSTRLHSSSKYRVIPTGAPNNCIVPVQIWVRAVLLAFMEHGGDGPGSSSLEPTLVL